jgi:hypothetical protein
MALKRSTAHILRIINVATNNSPTYNTSHPKSSFPYAEMCSVRGALPHDLSLAVEAHHSINGQWDGRPVQVTAGCTTAAVASRLRRGYYSRGEI